MIKKQESLIKGEDLVKEDDDTSEEVLTEGFQFNKKLNKNGKKLKDILEHLSLSQVPVEKLTKPSYKLLIDKKKLLEVNNMLNQIKKKAEKYLTKVLVQRPIVLDLSKDHETSKKLRKFIRKSREMLKI